MTLPMLKAKLLVQACLRASDAAGIPATVVRRGYPEAGAVLIKLNRGAEGCTVLTQMRDAQGELVWMRGTGPHPVPEPDADAYIERQAKVDPDLWVIEVEDRAGRHPLGERIV